MLAFAKPQIVMLDDDYTLLDVMEYYFIEKFQNTVLVKAFLKSNDFLAYIEKNCYLSEPPSVILNTFYSSKINQDSIANTLQDLTQLSAIIVLDQELRGEKITGSELSTTLREYYPASYISMLTSNIPNKKAIELHNNHNIDLFVDKSDTDAIPILYQYLSGHLEKIKKDYLLDSIDLFENVGNLNNEEYLLHKKTLMEKYNPRCFLTLNENGDIAMVQENQQISYWQFCLNTTHFIRYE